MWARPTYQNRVERSRAHRVKAAYIVLSVGFHIVRSYVDVHIDF